MVEARFSREGTEGMAQKPVVKMLSEVGVWCLRLEVFGDRWMWV